MSISSIMIIVACIASIILIGVTFGFSIIKILKLILNSILGGVLISFINLIGTNYGIHIALNAITSVFVGLCGFPGALLLLLLKII